MRGQPSGDLWSRLGCPLRCCGGLGVADQPGCLGAADFGDIVLIFQQYLQKGWPLLSHTALLMAFEDKQKQESGYFLLEPNFDIPEGIRLTRNGPPFVYKTKNGDTWTFTLDEKNHRIVCSSDKLQESMYYLLKEYRNSEKVAIKSIIAADRKIPMVSRGAKGEHLAHVTIFLDEKVIRFALDDKREPALSFADYLNGKHNFTDHYCKRLHITQEALSDLVRKIVTHAEVLDTLYAEYMTLIHRTPLKGFAFSQIEAGH